MSLTFNKLASFFTKKNSSWFKIRYGTQKKDKILKRCFGEGKELYAHYHDTEWGVPAHDDQLLFEMLILEGAQAGLSWETVLKRREGYRSCFHNFNPELVAKMSDQDLESLLKNPLIIRNRLKVFSTRRNARVFLEIKKENSSFDSYLWKFVENKPIINKWKTFSEVPVETEISKALSKDLKRKGMSFVGSTIMYAYMQAVGMVNDHLIDCFCYKKLLA